MSTRVQRVEELLRREIAAMLLRGEIKDHRVRNSAAISVTGVKASGDLGVARVFIDVLDQSADIDRVLDGLRAAAGVIRSHLAQIVKLRRMPSLRFERDQSIERGAAIERALAEIRADDEARGPATDPGDPGGAEDSPTGG